MQKSAAGRKSIVRGVAFDAAQLRQLDALAVAERRTRSGLLRVLLEREFARRAVERALAAEAVAR